jgi:hypothetical protein
MTHSPIATAYDQLASRWQDDKFSAVDGVRQHQRGPAFLGSPDPGWALRVGGDWSPPRIYRFISAWNSLWQVKLRLSECVNTTMEPEL